MSGRHRKDLRRSSRLGPQSANHSLALIRNGCLRGAVAPPPHSCTHSRLGKLQSLQTRKQRPPLRSPESSKILRPQWFEAQIVARSREVPAGAALEWCGKSLPDNSEVVSARSSSRHPAIDRSLTLCSIVGRQTGEVAHHGRTGRRHGGGKHRSSSGSDLRRGGGGNCGEHGPLARRS